MKKEVAVVCGHRLYKKHFKIIKKCARTWRISEAKALRQIIENVKLEK